MPCVLSLAREQTDMTARRLLYNSVAVGMGNDCMQRSLWSAVFFWHMHTHTQQ